MAFVEQTELNAKFPPALFKKGQDLGLKGAPIPQDVFNNFIAYLNIHSRFIELTPAEKREYEVAAAAASSRSDIREDLPQTEMQAALDAATMVAGYVPGIWDFMAGVGGDGLRRASIEDMATLSPNLIQGSKDGVRGYITGYSLRRPAHLEEGGELGKDVSVADAHTLGVIVRAATLGVRVKKGEVPADEEAWTMFAHGMANEVREFYHLLREVAAYNQAKAEDLINAYTLGKRINIAVQKSVAGSQEA